MLKADLHVHTRYSMDCNTPLERIIESCRKTGINCVAIADHGTAEGGLKLKALAPFPVIVAEEVLTPAGEIMGMFLKETIPSGITAQEAIARIKEQDGLVCLPHPFDTFRKSTLANGELKELLSQVDIIEVFNSRTILRRYSTKAQNFAARHGYPGSAGSDAHTPQEIGHAYVEMPEFTGKSDFISALRQGRVQGRQTRPTVHLVSAMAWLKKKF